MILLFAHKYRAYLAQGVPKPKPSDEIEIIRAKRIQVSNRRKLISELCRELAFEKVRSDVPFRADGDTKAMMESQSSEWSQHGLLHHGFVIFATKNGFVIRGIERMQTGGWHEAPEALIDGLIQPAPDASLKPIADLAAWFLHGVLFRQKYRPDLLS